MRIFSFPPIADSKSCVLILGTMPGKDSLKHQQYYAHPRNAFWRIQFTLFNKAYTEDYITKQQLLLSNRIALWDVLKACERSSSLDADIQHEEPNDIEGFLANHKNIRQIYCNGNAAADFLQRYAKHVKLPKVVLPSTSPAHTVSFEEKLCAWAILKEQL